MICDLLNASNSFMNSDLLNASNSFMNSGLRRSVYKIFFPGALCG